MQSITVESCPATSVWRPRCQDDAKGEESGGGSKGRWQADYIMMNATWGVSHRYVLLFSLLPSLPHVLFPSVWMSFLFFSPLFLPSLACPSFHLHLTSIRIFPSAFLSPHLSFLPFSLSFLSFLPFAASLPSSFFNFQTPSSIAFFSSFSPPAPSLPPPPFQYTCSLPPTLFPGILPAQYPPSAPPCSSRALKESQPVVGMMYPSNSDIPPIQRQDETNLIFFGRRGERLWLDEVDGGEEGRKGGGFYSSADTRRFFENCTYNHITITARWNASGPEWIWQQLCMQRWH